MVEMLTDTVEIAAQAKGKGGIPAIAVVLPTYQQPEHLLKTLHSLERQDLPATLAVIVVENHAAGRAGAVVAARWLASSRHQGMVLVERQQGNCFAYNAGFLAARQHFSKTPFIAIIDDDEIAPEHWLSALKARLEQHGVDIVGGPQISVFDDPAGKAAFGRHPVFTPNHHKSGPVELVHSTGNVLMKSAVIDRMGHPALDTRFNFTGGGDTDFFTRCKETGFCFAWAAEAAVNETVPARRSARDWITSRSLRNGMLSAEIQRRHSQGRFARAKVLLKSLGLLAASPFRAVLLAAKTGSAYAGSYHVMVAIGRLMAEFGYTNEQYRQPEKN